MNNWTDNRKAVQQCTLKVSDRCVLHCMMSLTEIMSQGWKWAQVEGMQTISKLIAP